MAILAPCCNTKMNLLISSLPIFAGLERESECGKNERSRAMNIDGFSHFKGSNLSRSKLLSVVAAHLIF